jgi:hypothetical protein
VSSRKGLGASTSSTRTGWRRCATSSTLTGGERSPRRRSCRTTPIMASKATTERSPNVQPVIQPETTGRPAHRCRCRDRPCALWSQAVRRFQIAWSTVRAPIAKTAFDPRVGGQWLTWPPTAPNPMGTNPGLRAWCSGPSMSQSWTVYGSA